MRHTTYVGRGDTYRELVARAGLEEQRAAQVERAVGGGELEALAVAGVTAHAILDDVMRRLKHQLFPKTSTLSLSAALTSEDATCTVKNVKQLKLGKAQRRNLDMEGCEITILSWSVALTCRSCVPMTSLSLTTTV